MALVELYNAQRDDLSRKIVVAGKIDHDGSSVGQARQLTLWILNNFAGEMYSFLMSSDSKDSDDDVVSYSLFTLVNDAFDVIMTENESSVKTAFSQLLSLFEKRCDWSDRTSLAFSVRKQCHILVSSWHHYQ